MDSILCEKCQELIEFEKPFGDYFDVTCKECGAVHEVEAEEHIEYTYIADLKDETGSEHAG